ncbi:MAG: ABC transporter permease subunit [Treponema sp.]|jgi:putative aldouronate transport system permease protein|nr:ABC transporter permease subunit [Treponema sp.]
MFGLVLAFQEYQLGNWIIGSPWVGLKQFQILFSDRQFWNALQNTICISALNLVFGFTTPIIFALLLNEIRNVPYKKFVQTASYLPHFISWVIIASIMTFWLGTDFQGIINVALIGLGIIKEPILFLSYPEYYYVIAVISSIWKGVGWGSIIYLASIAGIDQEIYEAATVDGAGRFRKMWNITLPSIKPTMAVLLILSVGGLFRGNFDQSYLLQNTFNMTRSDILETYVLRYGISLMRYSISTAASLFQSTVNLLIVLAVNFMVKRLDSEQGLF